MSYFDHQYYKLISHILLFGVTTSNRTGTDSIKLPFYTLEFDLSKELPILTTKFVAFKHSVLEMLWIYQEGSNSVSWLNDRGVTIWDEWKIDDKGYYQGKYYGIEFAGTIGTAYGYVVNKYSLVRKLIENLKSNPSNRRMIINLYQEEFLNTSTLPPCVFCSEWDVSDGFLNAVIHQRSCDVALGLPFNVLQYSVFLHLLAQVTGLKPGKILYTIKDAHIYVNQIEKIQIQMDNHEKGLLFDAPQLWINPNIKDFYKFDNSKLLKDIKLINYQHSGKIKMDVAV